MNQKTRKILSRIGAGIMLAMSLFNFGAIWTSRQTKQAPKRVKNVRQKELEEVDQEIEEVALIAERHAEDVIAAEQLGQTDTQESQQQLEKEDNIIFQQIMRYAAVAVWTVSLGVIFSSVLLDYPISFGKGILSLVPSYSQTATIGLEPRSNFFQENEPIEVDIFIETRVKEVDEISLAVQFNPEFLEFDGLIEEVGIFKKIEVKKIDAKKGIVTIIFKGGTSDANLKDKQKIANLKFSGTAGVEQQKVAVLKEESGVIADTSNEKNSQAVNFLGKTKDANFLVLSEFGRDIMCGEIKNNFAMSEIPQQAWEDVIFETKLPKNGLSWQEVGSQTYFLCAVGVSDQLHLLVKRKGDFKKVDLFLDGDKTRHIQNNKWEDGEYNIYSVSFALGEDLESKESLEKIYPILEAISKQK